MFKQRKHIPLTVPEIISLGGIWVSYYSLTQLPSKEKPQSQHQQLIGKFCSLRPAASHSDVHELVLRALWRATPSRASPRGVKVARKLQLCTPGLIIRIHLQGNVCDLRTATCWNVRWASASWELWGSGGFFSFDRILVWLVASILNIFLHFVLKTLKYVYVWWILFIRNRNLKVNVPATCHLLNTMKHRDYNIKV